LPLLRNNPQGAHEPARVVSVASAAWSYGYYKFVQTPTLEDDLEYHPERVYGNAKNACLLWMNELNRLEEALFANSRPTKTRQVCAVSLHPGGIFSDLQASIPLYPTYLAWMIIAPFLFKSKKQGAATSVFCALKADLPNDGGKFFDNCAPDNTIFSKIEKMAAEDLKEPTVTVQQLASRVWENTAKACSAVRFPMPEDN